MNLLCYVCLRLSECMNPFLYNVASTKMRRSSIRAVGKTLFFCFGFRWALWEKYEDQMIARAQRKCSITTGTTSLLFLDFKIKKKIDLAIFYNQKKNSKNSKISKFSKIPKISKNPNEAFKKSEKLRCEAESFRSFNFFVCQWKSKVKNSFQVRNLKLLI